MSNFWKVPVGFLFLFFLGGRGSLVYAFPLPPGTGPTDYSPDGGESYCHKDSVGNWTCDGGGGCFLAGTRIKTPTGEKYIEEVKSGDEVVSFNAEEKKTSRGEVEGTIKTEREGYYILRTDRGRQVKVTAEHPFLTSKEDFSQARDLRIGDRVYVGGEKKEMRLERVISKKWIKKKVDVYNMTVGGENPTFFANGFAVHNKKSTLLVGAFAVCWDETTDTTYPLNDVRVVVSYRQGFGEVTSNTVDTRVNGTTRSWEQTRQDGQNYWTRARFVRMPDGYTLPNGAPYENMVLDTSTPGGFRYNVGNDYSDQDCSYSLNVNSQWWLHCDGGGRWPVLVFRNCVVPTPTPTPVPGNLQVNAKQTASDAIACAGLATATSLSGQGITTSVVGPGENNSYSLDRLVSNLTPGTFALSPANIPADYYNNKFVFCVNGVKSIGSSVNAGVVVSTTTTVNLGLIRKSKIIGTLFDASDVSSCAQMGSAPKIAGGVVNMSGPASYAPASDGSGLYSQEVVSPGTYLLNPVAGGGFAAGPAKLICQGSSVTFANFGGGNVTRDFGFWKTYAGWWQAQGGDVYAGTGMASTIPSSLAATDQRLIKVDANSQDGLAWFSSGGIDLGSSPNAQLSNSNWQAQSGQGGGPYIYEYFVTKMSLIDKTAWDGVGKPDFVPSEGNDYQVYTHSGDVSLDSSFGSIPSGEKLVFLVDGSVSVNSNIGVAVGGTLTVISSGTITFESNVSNIEGQWLADNLVVAATDTNDPQFRGEGSFIGWYSISLNRNRGDLNNSEPPEIFVFRPDLVANAPGALRRSVYTWREVSP